MGGERGATKANGRARGRALRIAALAGFATLAAPSARAEEPVSTREPRLFRETGENTSVVDAFDEGDPFDLNLSLGFRQRWKSATIRREANDASESTLGRPTEIGSYRQAVSILDIGADVGLYKDVALTLRLPVILADNREITAAGAGGDVLDASGDTLFATPFKSPQRSGVDYVGVGLHFDVLSQARDRTKPTWLIGAEARIAVGEYLHACNAGAAVQCPDPTNPAQSRSPGISRGMNAYIVQTIFSRRFGYVEPYTGLRGQVEIPQAKSDFGRTSDLHGTLLDRPPIVGTVTVGMEVFPYENRETFQRVALDFKASGSYHSPGREYSELFDALGSSQARSLRSPNPAFYQAGAGGAGSVAGDSKVYFTGITDQQAFASFGGSFGLTWQTSEYVKFHAGAGVTHVQAHLITAADACDPSERRHTESAGPCRIPGAGGQPDTSTGTPNPNHRTTIDLPGRRFSVEDTVLVDLWFSGNVMF